jgi:SOS response associated peptidase (SRAP)
MLAVRERAAAHASFKSLFPFRSRDVTILIRAVKPQQVIMCGRFVLKAPFSELVRLYNITNNVNLEPRYNIPPTEDIAVVRSHDGKRMLDMLRWGLVPWWAKDIKIGFSLINAKGETVAEKPAFRDAFKERRCIIPADGFYEWKKLDAKRKQPCHRDEGPQRVRLRRAVEAMEGSGERPGDPVLHDHHDHAQ